MNNNNSKASYRALCKAVELAGGQHAFALLCGGKVRQGHVYNWLNRNKRKQLPSEYVLKVETGLNRKITRHELRPDIYPTEEF